MVYLYAGDREKRTLFGLAFFCTVFHARSTGTAVLRASVNTAAVVVDVIP